MFIQVNCHCMYSNVLLTPKGLRLPYMEFGGFGHTAVIPICRWIF
jgi:hypothetical protein